MTRQEARLKALELAMNWHAMSRTEPGKLVATAITILDFVDEGTTVLNDEDLAVFVREGYDDVQPGEKIT